MTEAPGAGETEGARTRGSIARRMLVTAAVWSVVVLVAAGLSLQTIYRAETDRQLDVSINDTMRTLANAVDSTDSGEPKIDDTKLPKDERFGLELQGRYWAYLIVDARNHIVFVNKSPSFADTGPEATPEMIAAARARPGVTAHLDAPGPNEQLRIGLQAVQLPYRSLPIILYVGVDRTMANEATGRFALTLVIALGVLALGLVVGIVVLIRYGLRPLHEVEDKLHDVRGGRRDTLDGEYPRELLPLVKEINTLINHNRKVVDRARTHVGNLAHALKTPLAVLMNESRGGDRMSETVRRQTEAMTSNVNHYLKRAQAAAQAEVLGARTEIKEPIEGISRMLERLHRDKNLTVDVDADPSAVFRGEKGDLDELVGNLLDNAAKWCKSRVKVKVTRSDDGIEIIVDDDGPGLLAEHRAKALERGKRLDESEPGTGLGLSIVTELADIYGGQLHLEDSPMGGLRARLNLPAAPL
ncbi:MAG: ATP-binding protein [Hyphomonadaceae bacterium]|nr:ATP-binding protein [Hyphomonadaceae bacterium]